MYEIHVTNEGVQMMVCEMEDNHLLNTIKLYCRQLKKVVSLIRAAAPMDEYDRALYGIDTLKPEDAAKLTQRFATKLAPYVLEASLRGLDVSTYLQDAFDRDGRVILPGKNIRRLLGYDVRGKVMVDSHSEPWDDEFAGEKDPEEGDR